ncbi:hypothetical protein LOAG_11896 [Loa loa]|uniref:Uncharacterized protein n=1 Tax=Loa loa TaxID=7209 RepID=A0A1S0TM79_LOALO|nr:hypothetical protein LOAG_11896 [Loa loa]EFO16607.1 hypothetical protein LOAG_11896 [Loa loa]
MKTRIYADNKHILSNLKVINENAWNRMVQLRAQKTSANVKTQSTHRFFRLNAVRATADVHTVNKAHKAKKENQEVDFSLLQGRVFSLCINPNCFIYAHNRIQFY